MSVGSVEKYPTCFGFGRSLKRVPSFCHLDRNHVQEHALFLSHHREGELSFFIARCSDLRLEVPVG